MLYRALVDAVPLVFWGTREEYAARESGHTSGAEAAALAAAGVLLALGGRRLAGALIAAAGIRSGALAVAFPAAAYARLPFLVLGPAALLAAAASR